MIDIEKLYDDVFNPDESDLDYFLRREVETIEKQNDNPDSNDQLLLV